ncbi:MAG: APC family permease [Acidobacteriota bacterium]|nr:APC family permease [Acidobacteriota bacterium]
MSAIEQNGAGARPLIRGMGLGSAVLMNVLDMIGVGPFVTIPLIIGAMQGPQAMLGWIFGALFAVCDGLVISELGAAMPQAGGSYNFLKEIYGPGKFGRLFSFLFVWQVTFSAPLSVASGCLGLASYASYFYKPLTQQIAVHQLQAHVPFLGTLQATANFSLGTLVAIGTVCLAVFLLYRRITDIAWFSRLLAVGVFAALAWIIFTGLTHFDRHIAFSFPPDAFRLTPAFFTGLGSAMLVASYDYWGYYNICFLSEEVREPEKNVPRAVMISIALVAVLYIMMNVSVLGVVPWQELMSTAHAPTRFFVMSAMMERVYGAWAGYAITVLIVWTAFASVFSLLLGYSRVPYAAALDGNYFRFFARLHKEHRFPFVSLLVLGALAIAFCFLSLADVIAALAVIRIMLQFLLQSVGVIVLRLRRPEMPRPFRMWLYPLPALIASAGFLYILFSRPGFAREIRYALVLLISGLVIFFVRALLRREWPFGPPVISGTAARTE